MCQGYGYSDECLFPLQLFLILLRMSLQKTTEDRMNNEKKLTRSLNDRMLAGVCAGLADYLGMDPTVIRLIFVLLFFVSGPGVLLAYLIMMIIVPEEPKVQA